MSIAPEYDPFLLDDEAFNFLEDISVLDADGITSASDQVSYRSLLNEGPLQSLLRSSTDAAPSSDSLHPNSAQTAAPTASDPALSSGQDCQEAADLTQTKAQRSASRASECSRKAQRRYRQRQKARLQQLQDELQESKALIAQLQSASLQAKRQSLLQPSPHQAGLAKPQMSYIAWQAPDTPHASVIEVLQTPWTSWCALLTSDLQPHEEQACQHIAKLSLPDLAAIRHGYVTRMSKLLLSVGQEVHGSGARSLEQLKQEYCCLHAIKTRVAPQTWVSFFNWPSTHTETQARQNLAVSTPEPDWGAILRMVHLTEEQKAAVCAQRRAYFTNAALLAKQRQQLLRQLQSAPAVKLGNRQLEAAAYAEEGILQQLQSCLTQQNMLYLQLMTQVGHRILTLWQSCVVICHAFPVSPDVIGIANAIAEPAGEPSAHDLAEACGGSQGSQDSCCYGLLRPQGSMNSCGGGTHQRTASEFITNEVTAQEIFGGV